MASKPYQRRKRLWRLPFRWTMDGHITVEAPTEASAKVMARALEGDLKEAMATIRHWRIMGEPVEITEG